MAPIAPRLVVLIGQGMAGGEPVGWWDVLRRDVIPVAAAYVAFLGLLATYRRATRSSGEALDHRAPVYRRLPVRGALAGTPRWPDLIRYLASTVAGGYVFFLSIVVVFYFVLGGEDESLIRQALVEGSLLAFAFAAPAFLLLSGLEELGSRRRAMRSQRGSRTDEQP